jgi:hypothetical protein
MHRRAAADKPLSALDGPGKLRDSNDCWILTDSRTALLTRRPWQLATLLSISFLAVGGAVFEYAGLAAQGGSFLTLLAWIPLIIATIVFVVVRSVGTTGPARQENPG